MLNLGTDWMWGGFRLLASVTGLVTDHLHL